MVLLEGAPLLEREPRDGRKVRPAFVFGVLAALALATLIAVIVRAIPEDSPATRDPVRPSAPAPGAYYLDLIPRVSPAQAADLTSLPWRLVGIDGRPHSLQLYYAGGGCTTPIGVSVRETKATVTIKAVGRTTPNATACPSIGYVRAGTVLLDRALGHRALWHAPVGREGAGDAGLLDS